MTVDNPEFQKRLDSARKVQVLTEAPRKFASGKSIPRIGRTSSLRKMTAPRAGL